MKRNRGGKEGYWARLKQHPLLYNAVLIVLVFLGVAVVAYVAMAFGTRHGMKRTVPDFTGLQLSDAEHFGSRRGLKLIVNDSLYVPAYPGGIVLDQLPKGGVDVKSGRKIYVTINSFRQKQVSLPYVAGRSLRQAKNMLENAGLEIKELIYVNDIATNYVLAEFYGGEEITPTTKMKVEKGSGVTLRVGVTGGYGTAVVPRLVGRQLFEAKGKLWEMGLNVGEVHYDEGITMLNRNDARVYRQSLAQGSEAVLGARVTLYLTLDTELLAKSEVESERQARVALKEREMQDSLRQAALADSLAKISAETPATTTTEPQQTTEDEFFL